MTHKIFILLLLFCYQKIHGQKTSYSVSLFYALNQTNPINFNKLDSLYNTVDEKIETIKIIAYADFLGDKKFNEELSKKRAEALVNYFELNLKHRADPASIKTEGRGEQASVDNHSALGEPYQRRADVFLSTQTAGMHTVATVPKKEINNTGNDLFENIKELKPGQTLPIEGLLFIPGRHVALQSSMPVLEQLVETLKQHSNLIIEIQGHICCLTDEPDGFDYDDLNRKLSENRAKAVYDFLVKNGISASRLSYKGYGHSNPKVFPETSELDEQLNRRVEIRLVGE
ncbi:MAG TPA: OmpA family protein [Bacteroidia bacterium]|nr:OmpA family protein [Bacteroidia bacterium]